MRKSHLLHKSSARLKKADTGFKIALIAVISCGLAASVLGIIFAENAGSLAASVCAVIFCTISLAFSIVLTAANFIRRSEVRKRQAESAALIEELEEE